VPNARLRRHLDDDALDAAGNQALNVHPEFTYHLVDAGKVLLISGGRVAGELPRALPAFRHDARACKGRALENIRFQHPFYDRTAPIYLGEYVTLDTGTGIVHSAPAYGVEDFESCRRYGMKDEEILTPVLGDGKFAASLPLFGGQPIWKANTEIVEGARERGVLLRERTLRPQLHALLAPQDAGDPARDHAMVRVDGQARGRRTPARHGAARDREHAVLPVVGPGAAARHDRQPPRLDAVAPAAVGRADAVLPARETGELHPRTPSCSRKSRKRVEQGGIEAWQSVDAESSVRTRAYEKSRDTLDVWFDSGSTHRTVLRGSQPELGFPRTSISRAPTSIAAGSQLAADLLHDRWSAALQALLTHGFVDRPGRPQDVEVEGQHDGAAGDLGTLGAEILRLWVASGDFSGELTISSEILKRVVESYRRIRNTLRFLLANTSDFDAAKQAVPVARMARSIATRSR
jgi:isoleucyl-tRNA synthetase